GVGGPEEGGSGAPGGWWSAAGSRRSPRPPAGPRAPHLATTPSRWMLPEPRSVFLGASGRATATAPPVGSASAAWHRSPMPQRAYVVLGATGGIGSPLCPPPAAPAAPVTLAPPAC